MAGRGTVKAQPGGSASSVVGACSYEAFDKLTSSTLKRHPKMELSKSDLLKLLSVLEGELQAREVVIAVLKAEQVKQLLYPRKTSTTTGTDPWSSLQRDVLGAYDGHFDAAAVKALYHLQLQYLENLIVQHRRVQNKLKEEMRGFEQKCTKLSRELDDEKRKHAQDTEQGDDVTYLLEKERERLRQEVEYERQQCRKMEKDLKQVSASLDQERMRQKQIVLLLLAERKRLILRLIQERQKSEELIRIINDEKTRVADMVEGLEEESKKSLQMEEEMERQAAEFDLEREQYQSQISELRQRNLEQQTELDKLRTELEAAQNRPVPQLGEGVRSTIVTMVTTPPTIRAVPTVSPTPSPPRGVARAVSPKPVAPATPAKPPGLVPQIPPKPLPVQSKPFTTEVGAGSATATATPAAATSLPTTATLTPHGSSPPSAAATPTVKVGNKPCSPVPPARPISPHAVDGTAEPPRNQTTESTTPDRSGGVTAPALTHGQTDQAALKASSSASTKPAGTPPRKPLPAGRPTPPPVPPNKPVLQRKDLGPKPPVPPRTVPDNQVGDCSGIATLDLFGPELADFQNLLVSMVSEKNDSQQQMS